MLTQYVIQYLTREEVSTNRHNATLMCYYCYVRHGIIWGILSLGSYNDRKNQGYIEVLLLVHCFSLFCGDEPSSSQSAIQSLSKACVAEVIQARVAKVILMRVPELISLIIKALNDLFNCVIVMCSPPNHGMGPCITGLLTVCVLNGTLFPMGPGEK
jgi:hypothetical protein